MWGRSTRFSQSMEMSRLTRDGTAETVSRGQIIRREHEQGQVHFRCSADNVQDGQPYTYDPYTCYPEYGDEHRLTRDRTAEPVSRDQIFRHARGQRIFIFPVQLTTSRIGNLAQLIHTLLYVMTIHTYIYAALDARVV